MEIKIYIDVLWLINFIMNYILLWLTGLLLHQPLRRVRQLCTAALAALYAVGAFFLPLPFVSALPARLTVGAAMVIFAFRPHGVKALTKYVCVFYVVTFVMGGAAFALFYATGGAAMPGMVIQNGIVYVNLPVYRLLAVSCVAVPVLKTAFRLAERLSAAHPLIYRVRIQHNGNAVTLRGFYDSGNLLREDSTGRGVIIASKSSIAPLFEGHNDLSAADMPMKTLHCHTLQGNMQLKAFLPDAVYAGTGRSLLRLKPVYIAVTNETPNEYNTWEAILPRDFEGANQHESNFNQNTADIVAPAVRQGEKMADL